jgi:hypothetical protein
VFAAELPSNTLGLLALPVQVPNLDTIYQSVVNSYGASFGALLCLTSAVIISRKAQAISNAKGISPYIGKGVDPAFQANRVRLDVPPGACVVLAIPVLFYPSFSSK